MQRRNMLFGILGVSILAGCGDMFRRKKKKIDPDHGKEVVKGGVVFRIYVISGVRFFLPISHNTIQANSADSAGFDMTLLWPDIPPGAVPGTNYISSTSDGVDSIETNRVFVLIRERPADKESDIDAFSSLNRRSELKSADYVVWDDKKLNLRIYSPKSSPNLAEVSYSISSSGVTPLYWLPVVIEYGSDINYIYMPRIHVRIQMKGWGPMKINPDWERIFKAVNATLNSYRVA